MHLIGKDFKAYVTSPIGDTTKLVYIPRWDFRWQEIYRFRQLVKVTKGSVIHIECTYDNTSNNPFNPNSPPKNIFSHGDMKTTDEMHARRRPSFRRRTFLLGALSTVVGLVASIGVAWGLIWFAAPAARHDHHLGLRGPPQ